jgi:hypothetical protein
MRAKLPPLPAGGEDNRFMAAPSGAAVLALREGLVGPVKLALGLSRPRPANTATCKVRSKPDSMIIDVDACGWM